MSNEKNKQQPDEQGVKVRVLTPVPPVEFSPIEQSKSEKDSPFITLWKQQDTGAVSFALKAMPMPGCTYLLYEVCNDPATPHVDSQMVWDELCTDQDGKYVFRKSRLFKKHDWESKDSGYIANGIVALANLCHQIDINDYLDSNDNDLKNNKAYQDAVKFLKPNVLQDS